MTKSAEAILLPLQRAQLRHDLLAHVDILSLSTYDKLKHMTLHFLKYAGKIATASETRDQISLANVLIDTCIICLATANSLNVSIGEKITIRAYDLAALCTILSAKLEGADIFHHALFDLLKTAGKMAKSIESTDHMERGDQRAELEELIVKLSISALAVCGALGIELETAMEKRWKSIESRSIFHKVISE